MNKLLAACFAAALSLFAQNANAQGINRTCFESVNSTTGANNCVDWYSAFQLGDAITGNNLGGIGSWWYNGTTWDRARGDATNGAWVNVKTGTVIATQQTIQNGVATNVISCEQHAFKHITSATDTLAVQGVSNKTIRLCAWKARAAGTATWYWESTNDQNANCAGTKAQISGVATEAANTGEVVPLPLGTVLSVTANFGLCINSTGTGGVDIDYWYTQY